MGEPNVDSKNLICQASNFFDLMTQLKPSDCDHSIKEQIDTEKIVKHAYKTFLRECIDDPE